MKTFEKSTAESQPNPAGDVIDPRQADAQLTKHRGGLGNGS